jgi:hypothetical protein
MTHYIDFDNFSSISDTQDACHEHNMKAASKNEQDYQMTPRYLKGQFKPHYLVPTTWTNSIINTSYDKPFTFNLLMRVFFRYPH